MDTNKLTADYICEDGNRLEMALHVYEAMDAVRNFLIEDIFKAVGEYIKANVDGVVLHSREEDVYFWTEESGDFGVYATAHRRPKRGRSRNVRLFAAGVYADDAKPMKGQREEIRRRFRATVDWGTWSFGDDLSSSTEVCFAFSHRDHGGEWHEDDFLRGAILHRKEIVEAIAQLLVQIYGGMCPPYRDHGEGAEGQSSDQEA